MTNIRKLGISQALGKTLGLILLPLLLILVSPAAYGSPPTTVTGTETLIDFEFTDVRFADGNIFFSVISTLRDDGDISGIAVFTSTFIVHPDGSVEFHGSGTETATVLGRTGTFFFIASGKVTSDGMEEGQFVITHGIGGLAGIHGEVKFFGPASAPFTTYLGLVHFDP